MQCIQPPQQYTGAGTLALMAASHKLMVLVGGKTRAHVVAGVLAGALLHVLYNNSFRAWAAAVRSNHALLRLSL